MLLFLLAARACIPPCGAYFVRSTDADGRRNFASAISLRVMLRPGRPAEAKTSIPLKRDTINAYAWAGLSRRSLQAKSDRPGKNSLSALCLRESAVNIYLYFK